MQVKYLLVGLGTLLMGLQYAAWAEQFPGASGMARLDDRHYLVVQDRKAGDSGECLGVLELHVSGEPGKETVRTNYEPLVFAGFSQTIPDRNEKANDLEALCSLPGSQGGFLACESAYYKKSYGRIFELTVSKVPGGWHAERKATIQLPNYHNEQIEGVAAVAGASGQIMLILAFRGGDGGPEACLRYGWLDDLRKAPLDEQGLPIWACNSLVVSNPFDGEAYSEARPLTDLFVDEECNLWASAAHDPGNRGPFVSCVRSVGKVDADNCLLTPQSSDAGSSWLLEGLKIEAISATPSSLLQDESALCIATDDEGYGGVWRPLGAPTNIDNGSSALVEKSL